MARLPFRSIPKAAEFDIDSLINPGKSGFLCISETTWKLAYNLVLFYGSWRSRYYHTDPVTHKQLTITDEEYAQVAIIYQLALEELQMSGCTELTNAVLSLNDTVIDLKASYEKTSAVQQAQGQQLDNPPHDGTVSIGQPGDQFATTSEYLDAKCRVANAIYDSLKNLSTGDIKNLDDFIGIGGVTAIIASILVASGPVGWTVGAVSLAVVGIALLVASTTVNFDDITSALTEQHTELVEALYNGADTASARSAFMTALDQSATNLTSAEEKMVSLYLADRMLNQLFDPRSDVAAYQSANPIDCGGWEHIFDFTVNDGGWTNDATGNRPFGVHSPGVGWVSVWGEVSSIFDERLYLRREIGQLATITSVIVTYEFTGTCGDDRRVGIKLLDAGQETASNSVVPDCGAYVHQAVFGHSSDAITTAAVADAAASGAVTITITDITVTGSGVNPFI